ncbi:uncharacterized protein LOC142228839 [Haematobia irritans]|uniref:uncharacterized protein LOC142228839 n=1 Tax=Haematobia irritans TaxID=7368 RepID=UPI003F4F5B00
MLKWTLQQQRKSLQLLSHSSISGSTQENSKHSKIKKQISRGNYRSSNEFTSKNASLKMPTMTHTLERRLHRRSLDNHLDSALDERRRSRNSLTGNHNKENFGVHFMRQSFGNTSLSALQDLSNGKSPRRSMDETPPTGPTINIKRRNLRRASLQLERTPNSNEYRSRFSDDFAPDDDITPLSRLKFRNKIKEDSLSSSRMGDATLDRMLDAIIESARKDVKDVCQQQTPNKTRDMEKEQDKDESIHEMEVRTPQHLKRQRVVRRKNPKNTDKKTSKENRKSRVEENTENHESTLKESNTDAEAPLPPQREMIGLTLPNGIPSPETPTFLKNPNHTSLLNMDTPLQNLTFNVGDNVQHCSTPTLGESQTIKRCLSFSCASEEDDDASYSTSKRGSVGSSIGSSSNEILNGSCSLNSLDMGSGRGSVDVAIYLNKDTLNVHVIRCRDLQRPNGNTSTNLNAYVKVALICGESQNQNPYFQRTVVHRHSNRPYFDHCFKFDLSELAAAVEEIKPEDRLQMSVWHRDRQHK